MKAFLNENLTLKQKITLYRLLYTLNEMDFSYLRPVIAGTIAVRLIVLRLFASDSRFFSESPTQLALYHTFCVFFTLCFLLFSRPFVRKMIARFRIYLYRRKKRATRSLFLRS